MEHKIIITLFFIPNWWQLLKCWLFQKQIFVRCITKVSVDGQFAQGNLELWILRAGQEEYLPALTLRDEVAKANTSA